MFKTGAAQGIKKSAGDRVFNSSQCGLNWVTMGMERFPNKYTKRIAAHHPRRSKNHTCEEKTEEQREIICYWRQSYRAAQQIQSIGPGCRSSIDSNRNSKSLNPHWTFAMWETQSTIHRKFINFLQSRGTQGNRPSMSTSPSSKMFDSTKLFTLHRTFVHLDQHFWSTEIGGKRNKTKRWAVRQEKAYWSL